MVWTLLVGTFNTARVHADSTAPVPSTFAYEAPAEVNRIRALLELTGVYAFGFTFLPCDESSAARLRRGIQLVHLPGEALLGIGWQLDVNGLNTNFVGHPFGGSMYYTMARSNGLNVAESTAFAIGGSLLWELFGEVREYVSINDMIVTPLAGLAIAEPIFQLGAFFDRSSPRLHNRILGAVFAPIKSLNDWLDGRVLARTLTPDESGFDRERNDEDKRANPAKCRAKNKLLRVAPARRDMASACAKYSFSTRACSAFVGGSLGGAVFTRASRAAARRMGDSCPRAQRARRQGAHRGATSAGYRADEHRASQAR